MNKDSIIKIKKKIEKLHKQTCDIYVIKDLQMYYQDLELLEDRVNWATQQDYYYINEKIKHINKVINRIRKDRI